MKIMQVKNLTQLSKLISEMANKGAMKEEIEKVAECVDGVLNDELVFDDVNKLTWIKDILDKYHK